MLFSDTITEAEACNYFGHAKMEQRTRVVASSLLGVYKLLITWLHKMHLLDSTVCRIQRRCDYFRVSRIFSPA